ncbi:integrase catalytic subunit [Burkholderia multivorans]|nr:integrase catalytic subunit [Burkholderia multivorans]SAJ90820.1 integrase catalytic subunit [Burkholderia multivorans]
MAATERITMTMRELDRFKVIQDVADGKLKPWRAAERLGLTTRQIRRLVGRLREHGPQGLVSQRRAKPSNNRLDAVTADRALSIIRERYTDFGPTLACEKLRECHGIRLAKETVRRLMTDAGLWVPRRQRPPKVYQPRARRACLGELIQIDGSEHAWFEDRAPQCTLLVYVDDAASRLMQLHFTATESTFSYFEATRAYLERHGKPRAAWALEARIATRDPMQAHSVPAPHAVPGTTLAHLIPIETPSTFEHRREKEIRRDSNRHLRLALRGMARHVLPARTEAGSGVALRVEPDADD